MTTAVCSSTATLASIYTELALTAAERLLIPFSADGSSKEQLKLFFL